MRSAQKCVILMLKLLKIELHFKNTPMLDMNIGERGMIAWTPPPWLKVSVGNIFSDHRNSPLNGTVKYLSLQTGSEIRQETFRNS